ncbi:carbohydrate-binding module family 50 protein [Rhypophila decipiens]
MGALSNSSPTGALCLVVHAALLFLGLPAAWAQILGNSTDGLQIGSPGLFSSACKATFQTAVPCNGSLFLISIGDYIPTNSDLPFLCTTNCLNGLNSLRTAQLSACSASDVFRKDGFLYPARYTTDDLLFTYSLMCLKDQTTQTYCAPSVWAWNSHVSTATSAQLCSYCNLKSLQMQLNSPFGYSNRLHANFQSLTSSCNAPSYPVTSPAPYFVGTASASAPATTATTSAPGTTISAPCQSTYTVAAGDTCQSISLQKQIATFWLMYANKLPGYCTNFPPAGSALCIPPSCKLYTVNPADSCDSITRSQGPTQPQLLSWNPNINANCSNLNQIAGWQICVSSPGNTSAVPSGGQTIAPPYTLPIITNPCLAMHAPSTCFASYPSAEPWTWGTRIQNGTAVQDTPTTGTGQTTRTSVPATPTLPLAPGSRSNCTDYREYLDLGPGYSGSSSSSRSTTTATRYRYTWKPNPNSCGYVAWFYGVDIASFIAWNPSLTYNESTPEACVLSRGLRYCVAVAGYTSPTSTSALASSTSSSSTPHSTSSTRATTSPPPTITTSTRTTTTTSSSAAASVTSPIGSSCVGGRGDGNFAGLCDFCCYFAYCPPGPCTCTSYAAVPHPTPPATGQGGYPLPGLPSSYSGLCSFACDHGYCPDTACQHTPP